MQFMHMLCLPIRSFGLFCTGASAHKAASLCSKHSRILHNIPGFCTTNLVVQDAGRRLRAGASALKSHASTSQFFFAQLAQLQQHWNLKRSPPGGPGRFQIDVALPLGRQWQLHRSTQQPDTLIDVIQVLQAHTICSVQRVCHCQPHIDRLHSVNCFASLVGHCMGWLSDCK